MSTKSDINYAIKVNKGRKSKRALWIVLVALLVIIAISGIGIYTYLNNYLKATPKVREAQKHLAAVKKDKPVNILVVGTDERGAERARTDTMLIFSMNNEKKTVKLLSIPRDTYVEIPGRGMDKINHAHAFGGMPLTIDTVQKFLGQPIHYYVRTNFNGFKEIVDAMGGVTIDVDRDMGTIKKGTRHLNGQEALIYVRQRHGDPEADITRISRQQKFIKVVAHDMLQSNNILKLPQLLPGLKNAVETNMTLTEMLNMANRAKEDNAGNIPAATIPGKPIMLKGISYWQPDMVKTKEIINETFNN